MGVGLEPNETGLVVRNVNRLPLATLNSFSDIGVATIGEVQPGIGILARRLRPLYAGARVAGSAITVSVPPGDNWMIHVAMELCRDGDFLVVSPFADGEAGYFGELLATSARARGVRGLVIDAGCRDVAALTRMQFPVWSSYISPVGTVKERLGNVNLPMTCGEQVIHPGDVIVADDDGVAVVPRSAASTVLAQAAAREERETRSRERYAEGDLSLDVHDMRDRLRASGIRYAEDGPDASPRADPPLG